MQRGMESGGGMFPDQLEVFDLDPDDLPDIAPPRQPTLMEKALTEAARAYLLAVRGLLTDEGTLFHQLRKKHNERESQIPLVDGDTDKLLDAIAVIDYYHLFIYLKCKRAITYLNLGFKTDPIQNDNNGSAKVALIACRRSIQAWSYAQQCLPDSSEPIEKLISMLVTIEALLLSAFPHAEEFVRPGFDEG